MTGLRLSAPPAPGRRLYTEGPHKGYPADCPVCDQPAENGECSWVFGWPVHRECFSRIGVLPAEVDEQKERTRAARSALVWGILGLASAVTIIAVCVARLQQ